ncbi:MAG: hypothetical protein ABII18_08450 [bacterium]|nr:hypothetical protein [bacterium]MBU1918987.1 hypothetical protein [bacterium]
MHISGINYTPSSIVFKGSMLPPPPYVASFGLDNRPHIQLSQIIQPLKNPQTMQEAVPFLNKLVRSLRYGQEHLRLNPEAYLVFDEKKREIRIPHYNPARHLDPEGMCHHLTDVAYINCCQRLPGFSISKAYGREPRFFSRATDNHCFLLVHDQDFIRGQPYVDDAEEIAIIKTEDDPWVVDPSFNVVQRLSESGYEPIFLLARSSFRKMHSCRMVDIKHGTFLPLGLTGNMMYGVGVDWETKERIVLAVRDPNSSREVYSLDEDLSHLPRDIRMWQDWLFHVRRKVIG